MKKRIRDSSEWDEMISAQDKSSDITINMIMIESNDLKWIWYDIMNKKELKIILWIIYKQKNKKVNSVNISLQNDINLDGNVMMNMIGNKNIKEKTQDDEKKISQES